MSPAFPETRVFSLSANLYMHSNHALKTMSNVLMIKWYRNSRKERGLKNYAKFTGKHLCQSFFWKESCRPEAWGFLLYLKKTLVQVFSSEFCSISKNTFFTELLPWLLLVMLPFPYRIAHWRKKNCRHLLKSVNFRKLFTF